MTRTRSILAANETISRGYPVTCLMPGFRRNECEADITARIFTPHVNLFSRWPLETYRLEIMTA